MRKTTESSVSPKQKKTPTTPVSLKQDRKAKQGEYTPETVMAGQQRSRELNPGVTSATTHTHRDLRGLMETQLQDIYWAEKALTQALPNFIGNATSKELVKALNQHLDVTERQVARCETVFGKLDIKPTAKRTDAIEGLIREANGLISSTVKGAVRDAGIICAAQKLDHYKIATYGTLTAFANHLGENEVAQLLSETLKEEKAGDQVLTKVTEQEILDAAIAK
jgi:ferritin-like metal-binding protein YciE